MPDSHNRGERDYSAYDAMTDEELRRILREDANKPEGEESDLDLILYVMEVLARRRNERNESRDPEKALEAFKSYYGPDSETVPEKIADGKKNGARHWKRGLIAAAAALAIVIGGTATAGAFGINVLEIVAKWTEDTFHFGAVRQTDGPDSGAGLPCASLQELLDSYEITEDLVPAWLPEGYEVFDVQVNETPVQRQFTAAYNSGDKIIKMTILDFLNADPELTEKSESLVEIYQTAGVDYYIFDNFDSVKAVWINKNFQCSMAGPLTIEEMKKMIDSIERG